MKTRLDPEHVADKRSGAAGRRPGAYTSILSSELTDLCDDLGDLHTANAALLERVEAAETAAEQAKNKQPGSPVGKAAVETIAEESPKKK